MDRVARGIRSRIMASVKSRDTTPELAVRRALHSAGIRYRLHVKELSGKPDIVLPSRRVAVFVHGCFWHGCPKCASRISSKSNLRYWKPKIARNRERDSQSQAVGFLGGGVSENAATAPAAFRKGLSETGFVEGRNVTIDYRFANNAGAERLKEFAADLVRRQVTVIAATGLSAALAAKAAAATIPIVFRTGDDPVQYGLVASFNRPGGNVTGINDIGADLGAKRLGLLHDLLPGASRFAALVDPTSSATESKLAEVTAAASAIGCSIEVVTASTSSEVPPGLLAITDEVIE